MDVEFLGGLFDTRARKQAEAPGSKGVQTAADVLQWAYVSGLQADPEIGLTVTSSPFIGAFPRLSRSLVVRTRAFDLGSPGSHKVVGFVNLPIFKHFWRAVGLSKASKSWAHKVGGTGLAIGYSMTLPVVYGLAATKRCFPRVRTVLIVPDLPSEMNTGDARGRVYEILKSVDQMIMRKHLELIDGFVVLTEHMTSQFPVDRPSLVIEGIYPPEDNTVKAWIDVPSVLGIAEPLRDLDLIVYAGALNTRYGVINLCRAFMKLPSKRLRLVLCGEGDASHEVDELRSQDPRILATGRIARHEVLAIERAAAILVNPRPGTENFTKYSFPSKTLEYMQAGRPIVCFHLPGIPRDYDPYLSYVHEEHGDEEGLERAIMSVMELTAEERSALGRRAKEFAKNQKSAAMRGQQLLSFSRTLGDAGSAQAD